MTIILLILTKDKAKTNYTAHVLVFSIILEIFIQCHLKELRLFLS